MGTGILLATIGIYIILISKMFAKLIALKSNSKNLELGLRVSLSLFGLLFLVLGSLVFLDLVQVISTISDESSYIFIASGVINIFLSPILSNLFIKKFSDNEYVTTIERKNFYLFFIGLGIITLMIGIFGLTGF